MLTQQLVYRFLNEEKLAPRVKWECFLLVFSGVRSASLITVPNDLPDGLQIRHTMEQVYAVKYLNGVDILQSGFKELGQRLRYTIQRLTQKTAVFKRMLMEETFQDLIRTSSTYQRHLFWADRLELFIHEEQLIPSKGELYVYRDEKHAALVRALIERRKVVRERSHENVPLPIAGNSLLPEDSDPTYLRYMGALLGYPSCCVEAFIEDRLEERVPEERAVQQLETMREHGLDPQEKAYFVRGFIPCRPDCEEAARVGERYAESLMDIDPRFADAYASGLGGNLALVEGYMELKRLREERYASMQHARVQEGKSVS